MNDTSDTALHSGSSAASAGDTALSSLASITVTYQPDLAVLRRQLVQLPEATAKIVIDNASSPALRAALRQLVAGVPRASLSEQPRNLGLAAGLNEGLRIARTLTGISHVLLLDQDTEPDIGQTERLLEAHESLRSRDPRTGCVGPALIDPATGLQHGFHRARFGVWTRQFPPPDSTSPVQCDNLNGSGTLMQLALAEELGGLDADLFIDHIDTEWSFRVKAAGYRLYGIPQVRFSHRMGERSLRFWLFGWRLWPYRSPRRHYYLFRNAVRLMRRDYVPLTWKTWALVKLVLTAAVHAIADAARREQWRAMIGGARAGFKHGADSYFENNL